MPVSPTPIHVSRNASLPRKVFHFFRDRSPAEIRDAIRTHGALRLAWNAGPGYLMDRRFDRRFGVQTVGSVSLSELTVGELGREGGHLYDPLATRTCRSVLRQAVPDPRGHTFVDYGSGKGRVLFIASEQPYARAVGVEFAAELHEVARRNVRAYRNPRRRCPAIDVVHADARGFPVPAGPCVLHFFTPFDDHVLAEVMDGVRASYAADPRRIVVVFVTDPDSYPLPHAVLGTGPFARRPDPRMPFDPARRFRLQAAVYEAAPPA